jgi:metallo-beta-lactamase family protein
MKIKFLGATGTVTGSKYLVTTKNATLLIDCGLFQGYKNLRNKNWQPLQFDHTTIDAVILTHAHLDHSGMIPLLYKQGYRGPIYSSHGTYELCRLLLPDSGYLQEEEAHYRNKHKLTKHRPALPLYDQQMAFDSLTLFKQIEFSEEIRINGVQIQFNPVGHILGAASIKITADEKTIIFSGDVGRPNELIMYAPQVLDDCDYLVLESTYGNRLHSIDDAAETLTGIITKTIAKGGSILIPSFAIGRSQTIMFLLSNLIKHKRIPKLPIYLDSPMAINATDLYNRFNTEHRLSQQQCNYMGKLVHYTKYVEDSKRISSLTFPHIIISASGMATGGRVLHHLKYFLPDNRNSIVFAGYQAGGTRGSKLLKQPNYIRIFGIDINVKAKIHELSSFSAHADYKEMTHWLKQSKISNPEKIFLVHGEPEASDEFRVHLKDQFGWEATIPDYLSEYQLN